jgi:tRNA(Ile)-lysidine synthase
MYEEKNAELNSDKFSVKVDFEKLVFPLILRPWKIGDIFKPLGMEGSKKLSDFFIQHKLSRFEKDAVPILVNANDEVIWIVGMRLDNRFKVTENTKKVLTLVYK